MNDPKISIIVPVYNCKKYIKKCLDSLICQTYSNYEIIVVNDGSTDGTDQILLEFQKKYSNVILINQENQGSIIARNTGLKHISEDSQYFCFCDSDDYIDKDFLKNMINVSLKYNADITQCFYWKFIGKYKYNDYIPECLKRDNVYNKKSIMNDLYKSYFGISNFPGYMHTKLYKRKFAKIIINLPIIVHFMADDLSINIRLLPMCNTIATISDKLYFYRCGGGTSKFMPHFMEDYFSYHKLQLELIKEYNLSKECLVYASIEIINVLHSWLLMNKSFNNINIIEFEKIVEKWLNIDEIQNALNNANMYKNIFYTLIKENKIKELYNLILRESYKAKIKRYIKFLFIKFNNLLEGIV